MMPMSLTPVITYAVSPPITKRRVSTVKCSVLGENTFTYSIIVIYYNGFIFSLVIIGDSVPFLIKLHNKLKLHYKSFFVVGIGKNKTYLGFSGICGFWHLLEGVFEPVPWRWEGTTMQPILKTVLQFWTIPNCLYHIILQLASLLLSPKSYVTSHKHWTWIFMTALFITAKTYKQPRCP